MGLYDKTNTDEALVPDYTLPELLKLGDKSIDTAHEWNTWGRRYWLDMLENKIYGKIPPRPDSIKFELISEKKSHNNTAVRRIIRVVSCMKNGKTHKFDILFLMPTNKPVKAVFAGLNFHGNQTVLPDKDIPLPTTWIRPVIGIPGNTATEESRNVNASRWQIDLLLERGYGLATACDHELFPDHAKGAIDSMYQLFNDKAELEKNPNHYPAICAWSWGLSRIADYIETVPEVPSGGMAVIGHSRLGKTSLWAGANDTRFKMVVSNNSGCGGASLFRRQFGEQIRDFLTFDICWFTPALFEYTDKEELLQFDQHALLALIAPRCLCLGDASEDTWADPKGAFLAAKASNEVYNLFGSKGLEAESFLNINESSFGDCCYHLREGKHAITHSDWENYLFCADRIFSNITN